MRPKLQRIVDELRKETCPQRIRDGIRGRIAARESSPRRLHFVMRMAIAGLALVGCLSAWQWQARQSARKEAQLAQLTLERTRVARQAENTLDLVGSVLLHAGAHSEKIISDRTVPPLRDSFELAKNKITQHIDL